MDLAFKDSIIYSSGETMNRISQDEIVVDNMRKNIVKVPSVKGDFVYTREDYEVFIQHFATIIKELNCKEVYNLTNFGAYILGIKTTTFEEIIPNTNSSMSQVSFVAPFKFELQDFMQEEFFAINNIINLLSKEVFSPALVNSIVKSVFIYQFLQANILEILQKNFAPELADDFMGKTKYAIKRIVTLLQTNRLI